MSVAASETFFITLSITGPISPPPSPGDYDTAIPLAFSKDALLRSPMSHSNVAEMNRLNDLGDFWYRQALAKESGALGPWWNFDLNAGDEMTYACDANLGSPNDTDCIKLQDQLGPPSDSIHVAPGSPAFLSSS